MVRFPEVASNTLARKLAAENPEIGDVEKFRSAIRIPTDNPNYAVLEVIATAFVVSDITYEPQEIVVPENPGEGVSRVVTLRSEIGKPLEFADITPPFPFMQASLSQTDQFTYRVEVKNIVASPDLNGKGVRFNIKIDGREKEIVIPFRVVGAAESAPAPTPAPAPVSTPAPPPS